MVVYLFEFKVFKLIIRKAKLYRFYFASDPQTNNNRTFIVDASMNAGGINAIGFKGKLSCHEKIS